MAIHFEELWEQCENFHKEHSTKTEIQPIIEALMMKLSLYKALSAQKDMPGEEMQKVKARTLGEIVLTLTCLSLKDNIDVYGALATALQYRNIDVLDKKHPA